MSENVRATNDLAFKKLFANNEYKEIPKCFIEDFYGIAIRDIVIENPYSIEEFNAIINKGGYFSVEVDSLCTTENNWKFSSEMQLHPQHFYSERALYYICGKYNSTYGLPSLMRGRSKYSSLYPAFSINILGYNYFKDDRTAVRKFSLYDKENEMRLSDPDLLTIGFFELKKTDFRKSKNLYYWRELFLCGEVPKDAPSYIKTAAGLLDKANFSKEEREMIDTLEKATQDRIAEHEYAYYKGIELGVEQGIEQGIELGVEQGIEQGKLEGASNMIKEFHISVTKAMQVAMLPEKLRDKLIEHLEDHHIPYTL